MVAYCTSEIASWYIFTGDNHSKQCIPSQLFSKLLIKTPQWWWAGWWSDQGGQTQERIGSPTLQPASPWSTGPGCHSDPCRCLGSTCRFWGPLVSSRCPPLAPYGGSPPSHSCVSGWVSGSRWEGVGGERISSEYMCVSMYVLVQGWRNQSG